MSTVFIYALCEPDTGEIRYVGKAIDVKKRYRVHLATKAHRHCANWINSLLQVGKRPVLEIIDEASEDEWKPVEAAYIQFFREEGFDLTNETAGGDGMNSPSPEIRLRMSLQRRGRKLTTEHKNKIGEAQTGEKHCRYRTKLPEEWCNKISASLVGNKRRAGKTDSEETRKKKSAALLGRKDSEETKLKKRLSKTGDKNPNFGKTPSEESRKRMSESQKLRRKIA